MAHPSKDIVGSLSCELRGRRIALGVTGSAAIYRSVDIARELMRRGGEVHVVMSSEARRLVSEVLFEWATGNPVFYGSFGGEIGHVWLAKYCDVLLIAPATASTIAKMALGVADTAVTLTALTFLGAGKPVVVAPAMHVQLYNSRVLQENLTRLSDLGVHVVPPIVEEGKAKMAPLEEVVVKTIAVTLRGRDMSGLRVLVTAGPTREWLDDIRFLSNPSSGRMGIAIAREAWARGADVTLVLGPSPLSPPRFVKVVNVETTEDMYEAVVAAVSEEPPDIVVLAAAPLDYRFATKLKGKLRSGAESIRMELKPTPKIAEAVRDLCPLSVIVGFAAEVVSGEELKAKAEAKMKAYGFDVIVANDVSVKGLGFASRYNKALIISRDGKITETPRLLKEELARLILDEALRVMRLGQKPVRPQIKSP